MKLTDRLHRFWRHAWDRHATAEDVDILRIVVDGWELTLRKLEPIGGKVELVPLTQGQTIFILAVALAAAGPSLLPVTDLSITSAVDDTGAAVTTSQSTTGGITSILTSSGASVTVPSSTPAIALSGISDTAKTVTITADVTDEEGNVHSGVTLTVQLPVAAEDVELIAFNAP